MNIAHVIIEEEEEGSNCFSNNNLALDLVDGLGEASNILASDTCDRDTTVLGSVNGVLFGRVSPQPSK